MLPDELKCDINDVLNNTDTYIKLCGLFTVKMGYSSYSPVFHKTVYMLYIPNNSSSQRLMIKPKPITIYDIIYFHRQNTRFYLHVKYVSGLNYIIPHTVFNILIQLFNNINKLKNINLMCFIGVFIENVIRLQACFYNKELSDIKNEIFNYDINIINKKLKRKNEKNPIIALLDNCKLDKYKLKNSTFNKILIQNMKYNTYNKFVYIINTNGKLDNISTFVLWIRPMINISDIRLNNLNDILYKLWLLSVEYKGFEINTDNEMLRYII